jgi:hypothetical protein
MDRLSGKVASLGEAGESMLADGRKRKVAFGGWARPSRSLDNGYGQPASLVECDTHVCVAHKRAVSLAP